MLLNTTALALYAKPVSFTESFLEPNVQAAAMHNATYPLVFEFRIFIIQKIHETLYLDFSEKNVQSSNYCLFIAIKIESKSYTACENYKKTLLNP